MKRFGLVLLCLCLLPCLAFGEVFVGVTPPDGFGQDTPHGLLQMTALNMGVFDCFLIEAGGQTMLVDGGTQPAGHFSADLLNLWGLTGVDYWFNTHPHDDHILGTAQQIRKSAYEVGTFLCAFDKSWSNKHLLDTLALLEKKNIPVEKIAHGDTMDFGACRLTFLQSTQTKNFNNSSVALRLDFGTASMLLTADIHSQTQQYFVDTLPKELLKADILKLCHHGYTSTEQYFIDAVEPELCFVSNPPQSIKAIMKHMKAIGMPVLHSARGNLVFVTDGTDWYVNQYPVMPGRTAVGVLEQE